MLSAGLQGTFLPEGLSKELDDLLEHKQLVTATQTIKTSYSELRRYRYSSLAWQPCSAWLYLPVFQGIDAT